MLNRVIIMGRLTADPEIKYTPENIPVCSVRVAVEREYKKDGERLADFFSVVAWRQTAEFLTKYFAKGQMISIDGRLESRQWVTKDGEKRSSIEVIAEKVSFCGDKAIREASDAKRPQAMMGERAEPMTGYAYSTGSTSGRVYDISKLESDFSDEILPF